MIVDCWCNVVVVVDIDVAVQHLAANFLIDKNLLSIGTRLHLLSLLLNKLVQDFLCHWCKSNLFGVRILAQFAHICTLVQIWADGCGHFLFYIDLRSPITELNCMQSSQLEICGNRKNSLKYAAANRMDMRFG